LTISHVNILMLCAGYR